MRPPIGQLLDEISVRVDELLSEVLAQLDGSPGEPLARVMEYHLGRRDVGLRRLDSPAAAGKRLRPALALLVCEAVCGSRTPAEPAALALELVHNFTLVHDDIQDGSDLRRHRPTVRAVWGDAQAINVGDGLWALANTAILRPGTPSAANQASMLASATLLVIEGQYLDIELQRSMDVPTLSAYLAMIDRKTAALFQCACLVGAVAGGASAAQQDAYAAFGRALGRAFQQQDDMLGVWATAEVTGKPAGQDVADRKKGLPAVLALTRPEAPAWLLHTYASPADQSLPPQTIDRVIQHFELAGICDEGSQMVRATLGTARQALGATNASQPALGCLESLCEYLESRM